MEFIDLLISFVLALIMFGIGASLKTSDFKNIFSQPKALLLGLGLQMLFLPLYALMIANFSDLSPALKVGLFIIAICPGGTTSNFISYLVNADVALSISLTCINSVLILITIPTLSNFAINYFLGTSEHYEVSVTSTFVQVFLIVLLPAILGVLFNQRFPILAMRLKQPLKYINIVLLALVFGIKFFAGESQGGSGLNQSETFALLPPTLILHIGALVISYFVALYFIKNNFQATTIGIEVGLQNTTLALLVTGTIIGNNEMTKPALVYAIFSFFTTLLFAWLATRGRSKAVSN